MTEPSEITVTGMSVALASTDLADAKRIAIAIREITGVSLVTIDAVTRPAAAAKEVVVALKFSEPSRER